MSSTEITVLAASLIGNLTTAIVSIINAYFQARNHQETKSDLKDIKDQTK